MGEWSGTYGSRATKEKSYIGKVKNYYNNALVGLFHLETGEIKIGDEILITGPTTGVVQTKVKEIFIDEKKVTIAKKGDLITIPIEEKIRPNDKLFVMTKSEKNG